MTLLYISVQSQILETANNEIYPLLNLWKTSESSFSQRRDIYKHLKNISFYTSKNPSCFLELLESLVLSKTFLGRPSSSTFQIPNTKKIFNNESKKEPILGQKLDPFQQRDTYGQNSPLIKESFWGRADEDYGSSTSF